MISMPQADETLRVLCEMRGVSLIEWTDTEALLVRIALQALGVLVPNAAGASQEVQDFVANTSFATYVPGYGTVIYLSKEACLTPLQKLSVGCHELVHADQIERAGAVQAAVNYLGSGELRAKNEGDADGAFMAAQYLFGPELPQVEKTAAHLKGRLYHLDEPDFHFAEDIITAHRDTLLFGGAPPLKVVQDLLVYSRSNLRKHIIPEAYR